VNQLCDPADELVDRCRGRWVRTLVAAATLAIVGALAVPVAPAHAANSVVTSDPADGASLGAAPTQITITFAEDLGEQNSIKLECDTELVALGGTEVGDDGRTLTAPVVDPVPRSTCVANWVVSNVDGDPNGSGNITFAVQADATTVAATTGSVATDATGTGATTPTSVDPADDLTDGASSDDVVDLDLVDTGQGPLWLGNVLSIAGIAVLFGALVLIAAAWPEGVEYLVAVRFVRNTWILAIVGTLLYTVAASAAVTGESLGSGLSPASWLDLSSAGLAGAAVLARLVLVLACGWVALRPDKVIDPATQMVAIGLPALAVATIGLGRTTGDLAALGILVGVAHALAMAVWVGGVVMLARVVLAGPGEEDLVHAVRGFGRLTNAAIIVTIATGFVQMVRLDGGNLLSSGHGRVVVLKVLGVAAMVFLAIAARQFVNQRLNRATEMSVPMADRLRRAFGMEAAIGVVVIALSAWLLALTPPNVDAVDGADYAIERTFVVDSADFEVIVGLTSERAGLQGLQVEVVTPLEGLSGLEVVFTAPANDRNVGTITQPVPLTGTGVAVRDQADGLPLIFGGEWTVQVNAATASGTVNTEPQTFELSNRDGSTPTTQLTIPDVVVVTIDPSASTTTTEP
jgi:copper transport protein